MGAKLAAACCTADLEEVTAPDFAGDSYISKPIFFADDPLPGDRFMTTKQLHTAKGSRARSRDQLVVSEVEHNDEHFLPCCKPGSRPWRPDSELVPREAPPSCDTPRFCSTPRASKQSEWNSVMLLNELNRHARSLALEFRPLPATAIPANSPRWRGHA
eukprot:TRINITY_DN64000_c0_g1_i1.p1 TRINITY_DN64000_c0_g1~~TRINITY_DN64000_c0_g1_i1.p1  ORF type:complete len:159 (-),score=16.62 TRINITY_DN64000_c0_g1_i1:61-537(-)